MEAKAEGTNANQAVGEPVVGIPMDHDLDPHFVMDPQPL